MFYILLIIIIYYFYNVIKLRIDNRKLTENWVNINKLRYSVSEYGNEVSVFYHNYAFGMTLNANDFFDYASCDSVYMDIDDLEAFLPIYRLYGTDAVNAYMHMKDGRLPLEKYLTVEFYQAINKFKYTDIDFKGYILKNESLQNREDY